MLLVVCYSCFFTKSSDFEDVFNGQVEDMGLREMSREEAVRVAMDKRLLKRHPLNIVNSKEKAMNLVLY